MPCAIEEKKTRKNPPHPNTPRIPQQPTDHDHLETARDETRPTRYSPYSPASIDFGFVEIGLVQLSQSEKKTNVPHTLTDTQIVRRPDGHTDRNTN